MTGAPVALPTHYLPSTMEINTAIRLGLGWGLNPSMTLQEDIETGTLVLLDPEPMVTPLYWQVARLSAPALAPLTRAVRAAAREILLPL